MSSKKQEVEILVAKLSLLLSSSRASIAVSIVIASLLAFVMSDVIALSVIAYWYATVVLISVARLVLVVRYGRSPTSNIDIIRSRLTFLRAGAMIAGIAWGTAGILLFPENSTDHQMLLIFMLAGMAAGGLISNAADLFSALTFSTFLLSPTIVRFYFEDTTHALAMFAGGTMFLGFMLFALHQINKILLNNILLKCEANEREAQISLSEGRYRTLVELTPESIVVHRAGKFLYANPAAVKMFGASSSQELIGLPILERIHPDSRAIVLERIRKNAADGLSAPRIEERYLRLDGTAIEVETQGTSILFDGEPAIQAAIHDITESKKDKSALKRQLSFTRALNLIAKCVVEHHDAHVILDETMQVVSEALKVDRARINDIDFDKHQIIRLSEWLAPSNSEVVPTKAAYSMDVFINGANELWKTRRHVISQKDALNPILISDGSGDLLHNQMMIQSVLWYPFAFRENGFYLFALNQIFSKKEWDEEELGFLDGVSHLIGVALEKIRLLEEQRSTERDLRVSATAFEAQEGMLITDSERKIIRINSAFTRITGYSAEDVIGKDPHVLSSGYHDADFYEDFWKSVNDTGSWEGEIWNRRKSGEIFPEYLTISAVKSIEGIITNYVATFSDISVIKAAAKEIETLAFFDPLTGLPNRRMLTDRLQHALASSSRNRRDGALLFIDLDHFKNINDTLGHYIGDLLLQQVAQRLTNCIREGDTVARLGGDEFVVMLEDLSQSDIESAAQAELVGEKILSTLSEPYKLAEHEYRITPSIGATMFKDHLQSKDELLKQADIAMYQAKRAGRNTLRFFDPEMQKSIDARATLEKELHTAISQEQFQLHYQMQVDSTRRVIGAEALIRWIHPKRGIVSPLQFIPLAEETGLIIPMGNWVLETACAQIRSWQTNDLARDLVLAVNVSAHQFCHEDFISQVSTAIEKNGIRPEQLKLELTESMLVKNIEETIDKMIELKKIGVRFSLDDFGTGYSSLQYLKRLPLDQLKIDQSFVRDLESDESDRAIVRTIIAMAQSLNLEVIAEGVETEYQRSQLLNKGCSYFQGYLFGKPIPVAQFDAALGQ